MDIVLHNDHSAVGTFLYGTVWCESSIIEAKCGSTGTCHAGTFLGVGRVGVLESVLHGNAQLWGELDLNTWTYQIDIRSKPSLNATRVTVYADPSDPQEELIFYCHWPVR